MTQGKPLSFDRDVALEKAMTYFWEHGYEASGMTGLLEHMGIQRQSFYNTFGSKEDILLEALRKYSAQIQQRFREHLESATTPFEKLDRIFEMWTNMGANMSGCGCFLGNCTAEFGQSNDRVREVMDQSLAALRTIFINIFQEAIDRGDLPQDRNAQVLAGTLATFSQGMALMSKTGESPEQMGAIMEYMKATLKT